MEPFHPGGAFCNHLREGKINDKTQFRVTLCLIWVTLNSILTLQMMRAGGAFTSEAIKVGGVYGLPFLILGGVIGNIAHHKIDEARFYG